MVTSDVRTRTGLLLAALLLLGIISVLATPNETAPRMKEEAVFAP